MSTAVNRNPAPRAAAVSTSPGSILTVTWRDGGTVRVDLSGWMESGHPYFQRLRDPVIFGRAAVTDHGLTIEWDNDEDLAIDTVHLEMLAEQQAAFGAAEALAWQERHGLSNQEAADILDVSVNTWMNYKSGASKVPGGVAIACRAMDRDHLLFAAHFRPRRPGRPPAAAE